MENVSVDLNLFHALLLEIIDKSNEVLEAEGILATKEKLELKKPWSRLFGSGKYHYKTVEDQTKLAKVRNESKRTVSYAMLRFFEQHPHILPEIDIQVPGFGPRKLYDYHDHYRKCIEKQMADAVVEVNPAYLEFYLRFVGKKNLTNLRESPYFDRQLITPEGTLIHYACHYYSFEDRELIRFEAEVTNFSDPDKAPKIFFYGPKLSHEFEGQVTIRQENREAVIYAWTNNEESLARPLLITLTQQEKTPFHKHQVLVGLYLNAESKRLRNSSGLIVFERLPQNEAASQLDKHRLVQYLIDPPQMIDNGGFSTCQKFHTAIDKSSGRKTEIALKLKDKYFLAFHMSKQRNNNEEDRLEVAKFFFDGLYYFRCTNSDTEDQQTFVYAGRIKQAFGNKLQLQMSFGTLGKDASQYQLLFGIPEDGNIEQLRGIYSGITRTQHIDGGRVILAHVSKEVFDSTSAGIFGLKDLIVTAWNDKLKLADFFGGLDNHLIDNVNAYTIFVGNNDFSTFHGVFNYYRTRTIKGKSFQVKQMPVWIKPNGDVEVKFIRRSPESSSDKEENIISLAKGKAKIIDDCVFIHLKREERYDGLAILWPPSLDGRVNQRDEIIPALYVGHSKRFHIVSGKIYFDRVQHEKGTPKEIFEKMVPQNLHVDQVLASPDISHKVMTIAKLLDGQLDNYLAIRDPRRLRRNFFGIALYYGACYQVQLGQHREACETLRICLLHTDFRDFEQLKEAFQEGGPLYPIRQRLPGYCKTRFDQFHGTDQAEYLNYVFEKLFN